MAPFNPTINPTNEPKYGQDSRAIDTPDPIRVQGVQQNQILPEGQKIGDRSAEYLGQAKAFETQGQSAATKQWGDLFANVVGIGDFLGKAGVQVVKKDIENRVYEVANRERENYTAELERIKAGGLNNILDANASADETPQEVRDLPDTLNSLRSARDGGKITKTDYQGRLLAEAKQLRAQYPGFKKEIDDEFAKVTGQNPANARINSLISEINRAAGANASSQNKIEAFIRANQDVPRADEYYAKFKAGQMTEYEVVSEISRYNQAKENLKLRGLVRQDVKETREDAQRRGGEDFDYAAGVVVAATSDSLMGKLGLNNPADVERLDNMQKNGQIPAQKWAELNQTVASEITNLKVRMTADADRTGTTKMMGGKAELNKRIAEAIKPLEALQDRIINKDFGGLHSVAQENKAFVDQTKNDMLKDSKAGPQWRLTSAIKDLGGEQYLQKFNLERALGKEGLPDTTKAWYDRWSMQFEAQRAGDPVSSFNDMIAEMRSKKIDDPKVQAKIVGNIVNKVEKIADSNVPDNVKVSIMNSAFGEGNNRFLSKLNVDGVDQNGKPVKGMNAVYQKWTSEAVTKEVYRLGASNPELIRNYENWAKDTFANELTTREIQDLSNIKDPNIKIGWDDKNKRFEPRYMDNDVTTRGRPGLTGQGTAPEGRAGTSTEFGIVQRSVNRLNNNIYNLKKIAEASGQDADVFILKTIADASGGALANITGLPQQMIYNMALSKKKEEKK